MASRFQMFLTPRDATAWLDAVEARLALEFVDISDVPGLTPRRVGREELQRAVEHAADDLLLCPQFFAVTPGCEVVAYSITLRAGGTRYAVNHVDNPGAVLVCMGGVHRAGTLIAGEVVTMYTTGDGMAIFKAMRRAIEGVTTSVRGNRVGHEAMTWWKEGWDLTWSVGSVRRLAPEAGE